MHVSLPTSWHECPEWWKSLVNNIEREANHRGIFISPSSEWTGFLDEKLKEQGIMFNTDDGVIFNSEEDYLVIKLKYGI